MGEPLSERGGVGDHRRSSAMAAEVEAVAATAAAKRPRCCTDPLEAAMLRNPQAGSFVFGGDLLPTSSRPASWQTECAVIFIAGLRARRCGAGTRPSITSSFARLSLSPSRAIRGSAVGRTGGLASRAPWERPRGREQPRWHARWAFSAGGLLQLTMPRAVLAWWLHSALVRCLSVLCFRRPCFSFRSSNFF